MKLNWISTASALALAVSTALHADVLPSYQTDNTWYADAVSYTHLTLPTTPYV